jgi:Mrp family chromosome partitioning ATPase
VVARRALLAASVAELDRLLARVDAAPLPASYRSLAEARALREDPRVRALLDSLTDVEREREEFEIGASVDPIYVALTTRATAIGRTIETIARARRAEQRAQLVAISPPAPAAVAVAPPEDSLPAFQRRAGARAALDRASRQLTEARRQNVRVDSALRAQRERANIAAPPLAILAAAVVLALGVAFAVTFLVEIARPRVSDPLEVERLTGARVLAVLQPREIPPERRRRLADRNLPPILDPTADAYRLLASHVSVSDARRSVVSITGDAPVVTAAIAGNIAAVSANDARSTMLVDADLQADAVADVLRLPPARGLVAVLDRRIDWTEATLHAPVGRDATIDVLPAGGGGHAQLTVSQAELFRREAMRLARRYDLVLFVAPVETAALLYPAPSVLVCAHVAHTPLVVLKRAVARLRDDGAHVTGIVLWEADAPSVPAHAGAADDDARELATA